MAGLGKSTTGRELARRLGREFVDLDSAIVERSGRTVVQWFDESGEAAFREYEADLLAELLNGSVPVVLATGGGAVLLERNRRALDASAVTVALDATKEVMVERLASSTVDRPLYRDDPSAAVERVLAERAPLYREVANVVVDVGGRDRSEVTAAVLEALEGLG